jgi:hypothetical protein
LPIDQAAGARGDPRRNTMSPELRIPGEVGRRFRNEVGH